MPIDPIKLLDNTEFLSIFNLESSVKATYSWFYIIILFWTLPYL